MAGWTALESNFSIVMIFHCLKILCNTANFSKQPVAPARSIFFYISEVFIERKHQKID